MYIFQTLSATALATEVQCAGTWPLSVFLLGARLLILDEERLPWQMS